MVEMKISEIRAKTLHNAVKLEPIWKCPSCNADFSDKAKIIDSPDCEGLKEVICQECGHHTRFDPDDEREVIFED